MKQERPRHDPAVTGDHRRQWRDCLYVYPVVSRRAKGLSIGVNLNPDKQCTFSCLYCQIDRGVQRNLHSVELDVLQPELREAMTAAISGRIWSEENFARTPQAMRRINDIAFSGDGEPTCLANFDQAVAIAAQVRDEFVRPDMPGMPDIRGIKIVVITNASQLDQPQVQRALAILDSHNGEIWAKLDAGSEEYFQRINRPQPRIPLRRIVDNITAIARGRPVVIQTLFFRIGGVGPPSEEIDAYCARLQEILSGGKLPACVASHAPYQLSAGGKIKLVQIHTIARRPQDPAASALGNEELDAIAERVRLALGDVPVEAYYGASR